VKFHTPIFLVLTLAAALPAGAETPAFSADAIAFFDKEVRPILVENCFKCHGGKDAKGAVKIKSNFQIISRLGITQGGEHGTAFNEDAPLESNLLQMVSYSDDDHQMPPSGKLEPEELATLAKWAEMGMPWTPADAQVLAKVEHEGERTTEINATTRAFWSNKPLVRPMVPVADDPAWNANPLDAFIFDKLRSAGLKPNPEATRATLIRRAYYDLIGLAPTPEEVAAFVADSDPEAWPKLIDRLLAMPQYGEKWARHWLDVVRYAESNGFERDSEKDYIWRYRDYVIHAFNEDKPYDQFVREQIAGDELDTVTTDSLIATGYHRLMQWDDEPADPLQHRYDVLDDNVRVTSEGFLGMSLGCARCHDHKGDPISQKDYYSFMAFFHGVTQMNKGNVVMDLATPELQAGLEAKRRAREEQAVGIEERIRRLEELARTRLAEGDPAVRKLVSREGDPPVQLIADARKHPLGEEWKFSTAEPADDWFAVGFRADGWATGRAGFGGGVPNTKGLGRTGWSTPDIWLQKTFLLESIPSALNLTVYHDDAAEIYLNGQLIASFKDYVTDYLTVPLDEKAMAVLQTGRNVIAAHCRYTGGGRYFDLGLGNGGEVRKEPNLQRLIARRGGEIFTPDQLATYKQLQAELAPLRVPDLEGAMPAMTVQESGPNPPQLHVHIRGNANSPGDPVEPAFPVILGNDPAAAVASVPTPPSGAKTSGRRRVLAEWMTRPDNRRTSRVMANRVWQHHFGRAICPSPNDFGYLGERPTHPELLDWLAVRFVEDSWSLKALHRTMMNSMTYRMSSETNPASLAKDPQNDLFWRHNMRRLGAEEMRDSILALTGALNLAMGGPSMFPALPPEVLATSSTKGGKWGSSSPEEQARRSIYIKIKRSLQPPELVDFDFADTDSSCAVRFTTTVPTQALNMLNSAFLNEQAVRFADNLRAEVPDADRHSRMRRAIELALCREATDDEIALADAMMADMVAKHGLDEKAAFDRFCLLVLNLNEFIYLD
jgi:hypothetical protein